MINIGPHISIAKGFTAAGKDAVSIGANTFQFFTRNPRGGNAKVIDPKDADGLRQIMEDHDFGPLLAHAPYTLNMASATEATRDFAERAFREDLERLDQLPCHLYNFHPGSHVGQGPEKGIELILDILNRNMKPDQKTVVLLEAMSGKGSEVGRDFEQLRAIIDGVRLKDKIGVCIDTCHIYSAGYDIVNDLDGVIAEFDRIVGLPYLRAMHLNDSLTPFNSHKDRHEKIGFGSIGVDTFIAIVKHPLLRDKPFFLETPQEKFADYAKEVELLQNG